VLKAVGVLPTVHHYYEPIVYDTDLQRSLYTDREIAGLDLRVTAQIDLLTELQFAHELEDIPTKKTIRHEFYYENGAFEQGDAEFFYSIIRHFKPKRLVEIGAGFSTLIARMALQRNRESDTSSACDHTCIEPFENAWLEETGAQVIREKLEDLPTALFEELGKNDIVFIDSSHIIRPQGDIVRLYLEILGRLRPGVLVHIHDIFTPKDYPANWVLKKQRPPYDRTIQNEPGSALGPTVQKGVTTGNRRGQQQTSLLRATITRTSGSRRKQRMARRIRHAAFGSSWSALVVGPSPSPRRSLRTARCGSPVRSAC
jgi:predicted O-methyltransferase YrrM